MDFKPQNYNSVCTFEKVLSRANAYIESLSNHNQEVLKDKLNHGANIAVAVPLMTRRWYR
jgi:hypothetical protein